jgi:hypothetical protein
MVFTLEQNYNGKIYKKQICLRKSNRNNASYCASVVEDFPTKVMPPTLYIIKKLIEKTRIVLIIMKIVFQDPTFSLQLLRAMGETYYKGADIGECLSTAYRIKEGDFESWYTEWLKTAKRVHKYAEDCLAAGHKISAREAYLRASNYYRVAEFLLINPEDPRIQTT